MMVVAKRHVEFHVLANYDRHNDINQKVNKYQQRDPRVVPIELFSPWRCRRSTALDAICGKRGGPRDDQVLALSRSNCRNERWSNHAGTRIARNSGCNKLIPAVDSSKTKPKSHVRARPCEQRQCSKASGRHIRKIATNSCGRSLEISYTSSRFCCEWRIRRKKLSRA